jgi:mannosyltransferase OCH1-like enzyme
MRIPAVIHQIWIQGTELLPKSYRKSTGTWRKRNPGWQYHLWDDQSLRAFMRARSSQWLPLYESETDTIAKADIARYAVLEEYGGVYADVDTECVRRISLMLEHPDASLFVQLYWRPWARSRFHPVHYDRVTNSVIASVPRHPIWVALRVWLARRAEIIQRTGNPLPPVPVRTGPEVFWPIVKAHKERLPEDLKILNHRRILTAFYLPRAYMRWYGLTRRSVCVLDFNDSARATAVREIKGLLHSAKIKVGLRTPSTLVST